MLPKYFTFRRFSIIQTEQAIKVVKIYTLPDSVRYNLLLFNVIISFLALLLHNAILPPSSRGICYLPLRIVGRMTVIISTSSCDITRFFFGVAFCLFLCTNTSMSNTTKISITIAIGLNSVAL